MTASRSSGRPDDKVPHYLFGQHPYLREYSDRFKVPLLAALGSPETMYPEFVAKLKDPAAAESAAKAKLFPTPGPPHVSKAVREEPNDGEIHVLPVQGKLYMLLGDGGNIAVQTGEQGPGGGHRRRQVK
jgi:hypothetical protein